MVYSLFPDITFYRRKYYTLKGQSKKLKSRRDIYMNRGWEIVAELYYRRLGTSQPILIIRRQYQSPGDSLLQRIRLNTTGVIEGIPSSIFKYYFFYMIQQSEFQLTSHARRPRNRHYYVITGDFKSSILKYIYTYPVRGWQRSSTTLSTNFWALISYFIDQLSSYTISELNYYSQRTILGLVDIRQSPFNMYFYN